MEIWQASQVPRATRISRALLVVFLLIRSHVSHSLFSNHQNANTADASKIVERLAMVEGRMVGSALEDKAVVVKR